MLGELFGQVTNVVKEVFKTSRPAVTNAFNKLVQQPSPIILAPSRHLNR